MRRTKFTAFAVLLIAAFTLMAAGCGGSSKNSAATTEAATTEATTTEAATTEATSTEAATTEATTEATTTSALSGLVASGKCKELADLQQKVQSSSTGAGGGEDLKTTAQIVQDFADKAPSEIKGDFQTVADYLKKLADVVGNVKPGQTPDAATIAKLQKLSTEIDTKKLSQAGQNITAWVQKNCHA